MALRIATLEHGTRSETTTPEEWQRLLARAIVRAEHAVAGRDEDALRALFGEAAAWSEPDRAFHGLCRLTEAVFAASEHLPADSWGPLYAVAAEELLGALEREPREPVLLNYAGVLLYELTELGAAEALFRAAAKLDPSLPHVAKNLAEVKLRKRMQNRPALLGPLRVRVRALGVRARRVAGSARPAAAGTISLCMIVKDEEEMLPGCLEPLHEHVDELIVVDTGSTDRTVEIAESFGATVVHFPWNSSFADARNAGLERATGDWILFLDADEHVVPEDAPRLRELAVRTWREAFHLSLTNYTGSGDGMPAVTHLAPRLFRRRDDRRFVGRIHERVELPYFAAPRFETAPVRVRHYGYLKDTVIAKDKSRRNLELLEREAADAPGPFTSYNLGVEHSRLDAPTEAARHFQAAWDALGGDVAATGYGPSLAARLAAARRELGDDESARAVLEQALAVFPDHTDYVLQLALIARDRGDLEEAERLAARCLELGDAPATYIATVGAGTFFALTLLADLRSDRGDEAGAEELWERSLAEHPDYLVPVLRLTPLLASRGVPLAEIEARVPATPTARMLAATSLLEAGRAEDAETLFRSVLAREQASPPARIGLIESLLSQRRYDEAHAEAATEPGDSPVASAAAAAGMFAAAAAGDTAKLGEACARAEAVCDAAQVAFYRAWSASLAGAAPGPVPAEAAPAATTALEALLRVQELDVFAHAHAAFGRIGLPERERRELLAGVYFRRGFLESAADEWIAVAQEQPDVRALVGLAQVAFAQGLPEDARTFAAAAVELAPADAAARRLRRALQAA